MKLRKRKRTLASKYGVKSLGVFGSYARGEQHHNSDVDILVSFDQPPSLIGFIGFERYLSELLSMKVDLVMEDSLKPRIGKRILSEVIRI